MNKEDKVLLCIIDGFGIGDQNSSSNAIAQAKTPTLDSLYNSCTHSELQASGEYVGLPSEQFGNSEVGHTIIGTGIVNKQPLVQINHMIKDGSITKNKSIDNLIKSPSNINIIGLLSDGGVHSHIDHFIALVEIFASKNPNKKVICHLWSDGRDVAPNAMIKQIKLLLDTRKSFKNIEIATICGRYYSMDRDSRIDRTCLALNLLIYGVGLRYPDSSVIEAIEKSYAKEKTDEFIEPIVFGDFSGIPDTEDVLFINFRPDRMRQIIERFRNSRIVRNIEKNIKSVSEETSSNNYTQQLIAKQNTTNAINSEKPKDNQLGKIVTMTNYFADKEIGKEEQYQIETILKKEIQNISIGKILSDNSIKQARIAETEKYAHVTYFFNGGAEKLFHLEDRFLISSPKVSQYNEKPEMSAKSIGEKICECMSQEYQVIIANFANCDMVGHTGDIAAAIKAVESVDSVLKGIIETAQLYNWNIIITSDHGNVEEMIDGERIKHTQHTNNPVPFIFWASNNKKTLVAKNGSLKDIAPTILFLLNLDKPIEMMGSVLLSQS